MKKLLSTSLILVLLISILAACTNNDQSKNNEPKSDAKTNTPATEVSNEPAPEPVTLRVLRAGITVTEEEFQKFLVEPTKKKYPHITLEWVEAPEDVELEPLITQGTVPDIIFTSTTAATSDYRRLDLVEDLNPYIEKFKVDLSLLKPVVLDTVKTYSGDEGLFAFPFSLNLPVLFYNKEIFDKFGVPYPKDEQMTWDETIELGKQVTRTDNGVNYIGFDVNGPTNISTGLDLLVIDPATGKANVTTPEWEKVFNILKKSYEVPGYIGADSRYQYANDDDIFFNEQNLATLAFNLAHLVGPLEELRKQGIDLDWDFAPFPNFTENLGTNRSTNVHSLVLTKSSKHKDEAFQVIANVLSDDVQESLSRNGRVPTVENEAWEKVYGADIPVLNGKTIANIFKTEPRKVIKPHEFEGDVRKFINEAAKSIALEGVDVNTALRTAQENIDKELETLNNTK